MTTPDDLTMREADLSPPPAAPAANIPADADPVDIDSIFGWVDRFVGGMERFTAQIEKLRKLERPGDPYASEVYGNMEPSEFDSGDWVNRPGLIEETAAPAPAPAVVEGKGGVVEKMDPLRVYQLILKELGNLQTIKPDMTVADALKFARDYKEVVLGNIATTLEELMAPAPENDRPDG